MRIDQQGFLVTETGDLSPVAMVPTPRTSPLDVPEPLGIITHTTDVPTPGAKTAANWSHPPSPGEAKASCTFVIPRPIGGLVPIIQCASVLRATWHAAIPETLNGVAIDRAAWRLDVDGRKVPSVNHYMLGVEIENIGRLERTEGVFTRWPYWALGPDGKPHRSAGPDRALVVDPTRAVEHGGRYFDGFPAEQLAAYEQLVVALRRRFGWTRAAMSIGHVDIDPDRRGDPWGLFREVLQPGIFDRVFAVPGVCS